ncbi:hypothetical protein [Phytohabitans houttuyneae]|uniref:DUF4386 family protein n=1 Tax=Phytohabitans houttuyneae TaxID=1076126 RepID=A0A6V8KN78_9ACTN|nr:hypothetical protein [Phytohabitans houttuyneae]GFJ84028.1 hypothetical protein Phou_082080 [Phytohabitans houttuyneae]
MNTSTVESTNRAALAFIVGAAGTALSGVIVQLAVQPASDVPDDRWSYPWSADAFVAVTAVYALWHVLIAIGLVGFGRSGAAGASFSGRWGVRLAVVGTLILTAAELASIPIRDAALDDTAAGAVGTMFGLGTLVSAAGLLLAGAGTLAAGVWRGWRRYTPIVAGAWTTALLGLALTKALAGGVGVYGLLLLAMAVALHTRPRAAADPAAPRAATARG